MARSQWLGGLAAAVGLGAAALGARALVRSSRGVALRGRAVIITGASRGLGYATAKAFAREGCYLAVCARDPEELAGLREELRACGAPEVFVARCDVTQPDEVRTFVHETLVRFGEIDVLVNNAAEAQVGPVTAMRAADYEMALQGIFWTVYHPTAAVLPYMRSRGFGRVVNVTSLFGKAPCPHMATYATAKAAATAFSEALSVELGKDGIDVSTVVPQPIRNAAYLNTWFVGRAEEEFAWFTRALTSTPWTVDAERVATAIVRAARYGDREVHVGLGAWAWARLYAVAPSFATSLLARVDARLPAPPAPGDEAPPRLGVEIQARSTDPDVQSAARVGVEDAAAYRQPLIGT